MWTPGDTLVIDWGVAGGLHVFCAVLAWSRVRFVRFATDEKAATTLALLAECFETIGGVPKTVLADRMGCLKSGVVANVVVPTADYVRFATHYGFRPDFCHGNDPESKGIVEHLVGYAKRDLIVPTAPSLEDLAGANTAATAWCAEVNAVMHSEICAVPDERLATEAPLLGVLPSLRPALGAKPISRKVDKLSCVRFGSARYSVPSRLIGVLVTLSVVEQRVRVIDPANRQVVAEHPLVAPGETSIIDTHYGSARPDKPRRAPRAKTATENQFLGLGEQAEAFLTGAAGAGVASLGRELAEILALVAAHGPDPVVAALGRAVAFGRWRHDLIICDELGFAPLDDTGAQLLFRFVAAAYERRSLGIGSHWPFESWGRFLPEHTTAVSLLDRLLHHCNTVVTDGDSYRMKQARARTGGRPKQN